MYAKILNAPIRTAQALGLTTSILATGLGITSSYILIPRLLESPAPLLAIQWRSSYYRGATLAIPLVLSSALSNLYLSYMYHTINSKLFTTETNIHLLASLTLFSSLLYTHVITGPTTIRLLGKAADADANSITQQETSLGKMGGEETVHMLVDWYGVLSLGEAAILGLGSMMGIWSVFGVLGVGHIYGWDV